MRKTISFTVLAAGILSFSACDSDYVPKPKGYFRIHLEDKNYTQLEKDCSYTFEYPDICKIKKGNKDCWINLTYPSHKATLHFTYKALNEENRNNILRESAQLAYEHASKAEGISETLFHNPEKHVHGLVYDIHGNAASNLQFFATDSMNHFLRASLYFYANPNADSIAPVKNYIKEDVIHMMESLEWKS